MDGWTLVALLAVAMWGGRGIAQGIAAARRPTAAVPDEAARGELEDLRRRVTELEERQDFTERVLARGGGDTGGGRAS